MAEFEYQEKYKYLSDGCLNLTDACNLACKYCFVSQHPHYMTFDTAKAAVDYFVNNLRYKKEKGWIGQEYQSSIAYFGGEPTLTWDSVIVPLTKYIKETYPDEVNLSITTNGTLLSKERIDFLYDNDIPVLLSIDGAPETQDFNRPTHNGTSSWELLQENIPYLLEKFPRTTFRATIYAPTVEHTFENYVFAAYLGFQNIFMIPDGRHPWTKEQKEILHDEVKKIYMWMLNFFENGVMPISCSPINDAFEEVLVHDIYTIKEWFPDINCQRNANRCGLGTGSGSIGYDGSIYGCQEQDSKSLNSIFYLGNIFTGGIEEDKHISLLKEYTKKEILTCENKQLCDTCERRKICFSQACPSSSYDLFNSFFIDNEIHCLWFQYLFEGAIVLMHKLTKDNNQLFKEYLDYSCKFKDYFEGNGGYIHG